MNVEQFANVASQKLYDLLAKEKPLFAIEKWGNLPLIKKELSNAQILSLTKLFLSNRGKTNDNHIKQIIRYAIIKHLSENKLREVIRREIKSALNEGATDLMGKFKGNENQLKTWFKKQQAHDRDYYGSDPYGANWNSFDGLKIEYDFVKNDKEANNIIDSKAEKWGPAIAVPIGKAKRQWLVGGIVAE